MAANNKVNGMDVINKAANNVIKPTPAPIPTSPVKKISTTSVTVTPAKQTVQAPVVQTQATGVNTSAQPKVGTNPAVKQVTAPKVTTQTANKPATYANRNVSSISQKLADALTSYSANYGKDKLQEEQKSGEASQRMTNYMKNPGANKQNETDYSNALINEAGSQLVGKLTGLMNTARQGTKAYLENQVNKSDLSDNQKSSAVRKISTDMDNSNATKLYNKAMETQNTFAERAQAAEENLTNSQKMVSQAFGSAVAMIPDMILSYGVGNALGIAGESAEVISKIAGDAGLGQMFLSALGSSIQSAKDEGYDDKTANLYGLVVAGIEVATEKMSGGLDFYGKSIIPGAEDLIEAGIGKFKNDNVKWLLHNAAGLLGEGFEEFVSEIADAYAEKSILGHYGDQSYGELTKAKVADGIQSFIVGAISALFMNAGSGQFSAAERNNYLNEATEQFMSLPNEEKALAIDAVSRATGEPAENVASNIVNTVESNVAPQNDIANAMMQEAPQAEQQVVPQQNEIANAMMGRDENIITEYEGKPIYRSAIAQDMNTRQGKLANEINTLAKALGRNVEFAQALPNNANGVYFNGNNVILDERHLNNKRAALNYLFHEVTHSIGDATTFSDFVSTCQEQWKVLLGDEGYAKKLEELGRRYAEAYDISRSYEELANDPAFQAYMEEELAAEYVEKHLFKSQEEINNLVKTSRSTALRLWQSIKDTIAKLTGIDSKEVAELKKVERMFAKALSESNASREATDPFYSLKSMTSDISDGRMYQQLIDSKVFSKDDAKDFINSIKEIMKLIEPRRNFLDLNEDYGKDERTWMPFKKNSDKLYKVSMDFSTLCKKRIITQAIIERLNVARGEALDARTQFAIEERLRKYQDKYKGLQVACALCYVEAARLKSPKTINQFLKNRTENMVNYYALAGGTDAKQIVKQQKLNMLESFGLDGKTTKAQFGKFFKNNPMNAEQFRQALSSFMSDGQLDKMFGDVGYPVDVNGMVTEGKAKTFFSNFNSYARKNTVEALTPEQRQMIDIAESLPAEYFLTADGLTELKRTYPEIYNAFNRKVSSATRSKAIEQDTPYYFGDSSAVSDELIQAMNEQNGLRTQSWSDFQLEHLLDQIAAVADLSTRHAKMHGYTKVPEFVEVNGNTGIMINNSLIPLGRSGLDENGNPAFSRTEGMPLETANDLRDRYADTDGNIAIGINDEQILKLLDADYVDYVIPYHRSGLCLHLRQMAKIDKWTDYTKTQEEKVYDSSKSNEEIQFSDWFDKSNYSSDKSGIEIMRDAQQKYLDLCHERGLVPKFSQFLINEGDNRYSVPVDANGEPINYWKMLIDRKMINQHTGKIIEQKEVKPYFNWDDVVDENGKVINKGIKSIIRDAEDPRMQKMVDDLAQLIEGDIESGYIQAIADNNWEVQKNFEVYQMTHDDPQSILADADQDEDAWSGDIKEGVPQSQPITMPRNAAARFSLPGIDSEGNELSQQQQDYFRDSVVRDEDGNLRVVYHGTDADFTVFDRTKTRANMDIQGNFFSPWEIDAGGYGGNVKAYYLNITNPAEEAVAYKALRKFQGQNEAGVKAREYLENLGYDGVNNSDEEYIAFYPEQIKSIDNKNPTNSSDIRFSLPSDGTYGGITQEDIDNYRDELYMDYDEIYVNDWETSDDDYEYAKYVVSKGRKILGKELFDLAMREASRFDNRYITGDMSDEEIADVDGWHGIPIGLNIALDELEDRINNQNNAARFSLPEENNDTWYKDLRFDTVEDRDAFAEGHPNYFTNEEIANESDWDRADEMESDQYRILRDFQEYESKRLRPATVREFFEHPERFNYNDINRFLDEFTSVSLDEVYDDWQNETPESLIRMIEENFRDEDVGGEYADDADWEEFLDSGTFLARIAPGATAEEVDNIVNAHSNAVREQTAEDVPTDDASYMAAVLNGDMDLAQKMVDARAREQGYNTPHLYHGTPTGGFTQFDPERSNQAYRQAFGKGMYFTDVPSVAEHYTWNRNNDSNYNPEVYDVYLNMGENPYDSARDRYNPNTSIERSTGNIIRDVRDGVPTLADVYVAKSPEQVKSAAPVTYDDSGNPVPLSQRFNRESNDIRYSIGDVSDLTGNTEVSERVIDSLANNFVRRFKSTESAEDVKSALTGLYDWFSQTNMTEAEMRDAAESVAEDLESKLLDNAKLDPEAISVLNRLKEDAFRLSPDQEAEARNAFGNMNEFRKAIAPLKYRKDGALLTDVWSDWSQSAATLGMVEEAYNENDLPMQLAELVSKLKESQTYTDHEARVQDITDFIVDGFTEHARKIKEPELDLYEAANGGWKGLELKDPTESSAYKDLMGDEDGIEALTDLDSTNIAQQIQGNRNVNGFDTLHRVFDRVSGGNKEVRDWLDNNIERPLYDAKAAYTKARVKAYNELDRDIKKTGIKAGTKESAAAQWYGEGIKEENGERKAYGLKDLKQEFPDTWENIVEMEKYCRYYYMRYVERINKVLEQIYPDVEENFLAKIQAQESKRDQLVKQANDIQLGIENGETGTAVNYATLRRVQADIQRVNDNIDDLKKQYRSGEYLKNKRLVPRADYFHHFEDISKNGIGGLKNLLRGQLTLIDTDLVGKSRDTKPKTKWMGFMQHRGDGAYTADAVGGLARYISDAEFSINMNPVIAHMRAVVSDLARATKNTRNANGLIAYLTNYTNDLCGKTAGLDRSIHDTIGEVDGRYKLDVIRKLNQRFKANAVGGNIRSALAQFSNIPTAMSIIKSDTAWIKGLKDYLQLKAQGSSDILNQSNFMAERYLDEDIDRFTEDSLGKKIRQFSNAMLEFGDREAAQWIWFSAYNEALEKGVEDPVYYADTATQQSVGGRGIGEVPYNMNTKVVNLLAPFQVEVNNTWQQLKKLVNERDAKGLMRYMVSSFVMESLMEQVFGIDVIPDFLGTIIDTVLGAWREKDEEEPDYQEVIGNGIRNAIGEVVSAIPGASEIAPIIFGIDKTTGEALFGEGNPSRYGTGLGGLSKLSSTAGELMKVATGEQELGDVDLFSPLVETLLPFGGKQVSRTYQAAQDLGWLPDNTWGNLPFAGGEYNAVPGSYTDKGALRFELPGKVNSVEDASELARALLLGEYSTKAGREYLKDRKPMVSATKMEKVNEYADAGYDPRDYIEFLTNADTNGNGTITQAEAQEYLDSTDLDNDQKLLIWTLTGSNWKKNPYK